MHTVPCMRTATASTFSTMQRSSTAFRGWTLVEMLVVVAIIATLSAFMLPMIAKIRSTARQAVCAGQLRQWGMALGVYASENRGVIPSTVSNDQGFSTGARPELMWKEEQWSAPGWEGKTTELAVPLLSDHFGGDNTPGGTLKTWDRIWQCPTTGRGLETQSFAANDSIRKMVKMGYHYYGWCGSGARFSQYTSTNTLASVRQPWVDGGFTSILVGKRLQQDGRLLVMSDRMTRWTTDRGFYLNHRRPGFTSGSLKPSFEGMNQLWADGRVAWRPSREFYSPASMMVYPLPASPYVRFNGDFYFYW